MLYSNDVIWYIQRMPQSFHDWVGEGVALHIVCHYQLNAFYVVLCGTEICDNVA